MSERKILGIIAEYNPFHNGHLYHLNKAKEIYNPDFVIAVMSGNYVQRGEPAIINKFLRARMAIENGIDLVIELPTIFAVTSAEYFATSAINILKSTGIINAISFGCETKNIEPLIKIVQLKNKFSIKKEMSNGQSYPVAFFNFVKKNLSGYEKFLTPNNILSIEYLSALEKTNWYPKIINISRKYAFHNQNILDQKNNISSGSAIRSAILNNMDISRFIPKNCLEQMPKEFAALDNASNIFHYLITRKKILPDPEGLHNRIIKAAKKNFLITKIISESNSNRYTDSRIRRKILRTILDLEESTKVSFTPIYLRVLGFKKSSSNIFKLLKKNATLPIITNIKNIRCLKDNLVKNALKKEIEVTDLYFNFFSKQNYFPTNFEYSQSIVII